jgi:hypothetical protein
MNSTLEGNINRFCLPLTPMQVTVIPMISVTSGLYMTTVKVSLLLSRVARAKGDQDDYCE